MLEFLIYNIPAALAYYVYISPLIRYSSLSGSYHDVLDRRLLLTWKLLNQGFLVVELNSWCICVTNYLCYVPFVVTTILSSFITFHPACNNSNMTGVTAYLSGTLEFSQGFQVEWRCYMFCISLFVLFLVVIVLSIIRFVVSDYPFGIFKLFLKGHYLPNRKFLLTIKTIRYD